MKKKITLKTTDTATGFVAITVNGEATRYIRQLRRETGLSVHKLVSEIIIQSMELGLVQVLNEDDKE